MLMCFLIYNLLSLIIIYLSSSHHTSLAIIALLKDVVCQVVNWVSGPNAPDINHALCQHWNDHFHQELTHVHLVTLLQVIHVLLQELKTTISQLFQGMSLLLVNNLGLTLLFGFFSIGILFFLGQNILTLMVEALDRAEVVVTAAVSFDVDAHSFQHFKLVAGAVNFKDLSLILLEEAGDR